MLAPSSNSQLVFCEDVAGALSPKMRAVHRTKKCRLCGGLLVLDDHRSRPKGKVPGKVGLQFWCDKCGHGLQAVDAKIITVRTGLAVR